MTYVSSINSYSPGFVLSLPEGWFSSSVTSALSLQGNYENRTVFESLDIGWQLLRSLTSTNGRSPHEIMTSFQNLPQGDVEEDPSLNSGRVLPP